MAHTKTPVQDLQYALLANKRDAAFVVVLPGGPATETWSLVWHYKNGQTGARWYFESPYQFLLNCCTHRYSPFNIQIPWTYYGSEWSCYR